MLLHFIKCHRLSICSSSMRIKFQLLPLILVITAAEVSLGTVSSTAYESSSSPSASYSYRHFPFLYFPLLIPIYIRRKTIIWVIFFYYLSSHRLRLFSHLTFIFLSCIFMFNLFIIFLRSTFLYCNVWLYYLVSNSSL